MSATVPKLAVAQAGDEIVSLACGEFLFREGDDGDALYIVKRGTLRIVSGATVYETVKPGGVVGEMALVDPGMPRSASAIACSFAELIRIDADGFRERVAAMPDFALMIMRVMSRRLRVMNHRYRAPAADARR